MMMNNWRYVVVWEDWMMFWRGVTHLRGHAYKLTAARRKRLEDLLGDAIEPAKPGQSWMWSWNDWNWAEIAGGRR